MTKIYLIRHAEAEGNLCRRAQGHCDGSVTDRGRRQIEALTERFRGIPVDALYSSDLRRAMATAGAISEAGHLPIVSDSRLREVNMGIWEDKPWGELQYENPEQLLYFNRDPGKWNVEGSEPFEAAQARMTEVLRELAARHEGGTVAAVSHGMAIRAFICAIQGVPSSECASVPHVDNTSVTLLLVERGAFSLAYLGDNSHLPAELSTFSRQSWWKDHAGFDVSGLRFVPLDLETDKDLYLDCYGDAWRAAHGSDRGFDRKKYAAAAGARHVGAGTLLRALRGEEFVGLLELDEHRGASEGAGWVSLCYIVPEQRGRQFGIQLVGQPASYFRGRGRRTLRLTVAEENERATGFYRHIGFSEVGVTDGALGRLLIMERRI
jgi:probable phosphoglycerate mutase